jgi:hypothetical protein
VEKETERSSRGLQSRPLQTGFRSRHVLESTCTSAQPVAEIKPETEGIAPTSTVGIDSHNI